MPASYGKLYVKDANGTVRQIIPEAYTNITNYVGATSSANGAAGLVPPAMTYQKDNFLRGDGSWAELTLPNVYQGATSSAAGVAGLVPSATIAEKDNFLAGDGNWTVLDTITNAEVDALFEEELEEGEGE